MADSWQKFLYEKRGAFAVGPFTSESSVQLLDVLVKTKGSNPILYNLGSIVNLGSQESQSIADRLSEVLQHLESNQDDDLIKRDTAGISIQHTVKSRTSLQSSFRIFGDAAKLDVDGDKDLKCKLERVHFTTVNRQTLMEYIRSGKWKPDVDKLKNLTHWPEPSRGFLKIFGESKQDLWVIYEILKAKKLSLASVGSHSGAVGADATALSPVGGPPVGGSLSVSATKKTEFNFQVPDNNVRAFAFKAIRARYDSTGEFSSFVHIEKGPMGVRGSDDKIAIDTRLDLEGLFLKSPGDIQDHNEDLECLEIVVI